MNFIARVILITVVGSLLRTVERRFGFLGLLVAVAIVFAAPWLIQALRVALVTV